MTIDDDKHQLREAIRVTRESIADPTRRSARILQRLQRFEPFRKSTSIAFYVSVRGEVQTALALASTLETGKRVSVPTVAGDALDLYEIHTLDELEPGKFGVPEPTAAVREQAKRRVAVNEVELIVVPGLVFDTRGGRIGYGRGFYDRLLASMAAVTSVGLAYECQVTDSVPMSPSDVAVDFVITEQRLVNCQSGS